MGYRFGVFGIYVVFIYIVYYVFCVNYVGYNIWECFGDNCGLFLLLFVLND